MRTSGILMPISSLPSPFGIGTMGNEAKKFITYLKKAGQTYWQILPICPTSYGDSPYQSFSSFAGNPYFIDLEYLLKDGLLTQEELSDYEWGDNERYVDYGVIYENRYNLLNNASIRFRENIPKKYIEFCNKEKEWLDDYALFMALKDANDGRAWFEWDDKYKFREKNALEEAKEEYEDSIEFYKILQYLFRKQWDALKKYANKNDIQIIGDIPIYVSADSADVWSNPNEFYLDENLEMIEVAGCPPDAFSEDGQLWGNPLFRWDVMKKNNYSWWVKRIRAMSEMYNIIRIDHFRGFDSYYAIPAKDSTAKNGKWKKGPGMDLFNTLKEELGELPIIVEDLGYLTQSVKDLLKESGFPGMKVLQFAFDDINGNEYLPHFYNKDCVVYTGTHDNDTILGWLEDAPEETVDFVNNYFNLTKKEGYNWGVIRGAMSSVADTCIITMQDIIGLGKEARMNIPSTLGKNWKWRAIPEDFSLSSRNKLLKYTKMYGRLNKAFVKTEIKNKKEA
ncbi:4-alpha-glucanotransferase [Lachnobacterium bovis]|uniref:4-alpha-glucanotransferase n=1 Tax=Lachnobacterium bovis TaxID=140626 RepID=UPI00048DFA9E|nr:4-alpha-glucanotransferase [Lachnobacterium bovis]